MTTKLPRPGTSITDLKCKKCCKTLGEVTQSNPIGVTGCGVADCPQKAPAVGGNP